jgi:methionine biosynthesis protein MetW
VSTPDNNLRGFLDQPAKALRYENSSDDSGNVAAKISCLIRRNSKVLDVGCGTGSVSEVIQRMTGARLVAIEPDRERAAAAVARGVKAYEGFLTAEFLREHGPFDYVVFADVLEHMPNPSELVLLAREGLVPGGAIVASVPNVAHWFVRTDLLRGRFEYRECGIMDATHLRWFTRKSIAQFFENLGFQVTALDCTVNAELPDYQGRAPWRWLTPGSRRKLVGFLARRIPNLFGCQFVISATPAALKGSITPC